MQLAKIANLSFSFVLIFTLSACAGLASQPASVPLPTEPIAPTLTDLLPTITTTPTLEVSSLSVSPIPPTAAAAPTIAPTALPAEVVELPDTPGIILLIGDGMGANHRLAATWLASGKGGLLVMDNMPVHGQASTSAADREVTDSGAAGTAISAGILTDYGTVGVDPDGHAVKTILEYAQEAGWAVGLVSTVQLSHATPASFAAHDADRNNYVNIARQMMVRKINVMLGGGENIFSSSRDEGCYPGKGYQGNQLDLIADAVAFGYTYTCSPEEFASLDLSGVDYLFGFFGADEMEAPFQPSLADLTTAALEVLSHDPDGFFLMVEAGQIDWASHDNKAEEAINFTLGLDAAVAQAKGFAADRPNTMIVVTADHETGGMRLNQDGVGSYLMDGPFAMPNGEQFWVDWSHGNHTADPIPVTAQGPYTELLSGEYHLTRIFDAMFLMLFTESQ